MYDIIFSKVTESDQKKGETAMIKIEVEAHAKTAIEFNTELKGSKYIYSNYRDIEKVEEVVKYVKAIFANKSFHDVSVSFIYDNGTLYGRTISRLFNITNGGKVTELHWYSTCSTADTKIELDKLTIKIIRDMYLECADKAIEHDKMSA